MNDPRGSLWRKCDFHVHTPFSALANNFGSDFDLYVKTLFKKAIEKGIHVIGITDYFTIEGYKKIITEYINNAAKLKELFSEDEINKIKKILLLPNVEFRLNKIVQIIKKDKEGNEIKRENGRINFHVLFSESLTIKQIEESFLHSVDFVYEADPFEPDKLKKLKADNLEELGRKIMREQPEITGSDLQVGMTHAVVDDEKITKLLTGNNDFKEQYMIVVPSDEDLSEISWKSQDSHTRKILISRSNALFSSNQNTIAFGLGEKAESKEAFLSEFKSFKPCIWGSDSHDYDNLFEPDKRRYCWVKSDPTFKGITNILHEPKDRVYIGEYPSLYSRIKENPNNYIESLSVTCITDYDNKKGIWFKNFNLKFGFELIAIIGNKGKGKSAIADILGLLGNSSIDRRDYSFLRPDKFCQKGYAENFIATLNWVDKHTSTKLLNASPDPTTTERIKYIPQAYLEKLCNNEDSGFKEEINKVVFSRLDDSDRLGKNSFSELEKFKTELINQNIGELKLQLDSLNSEIDTLEQKKDSNYKSLIEKSLLQKKTELESHEKEFANISIVMNPENDPASTEEQKGKAVILTAVNASISEVEALLAQNNQSLAQSKIRLAALTAFLNEINTTAAKFSEWKAERSEKYSAYGLNIDNLINLTHNTTQIQSLIKKEETLIDSLSILLSKKSQKSTEGVEKSLHIQLSELTIKKNTIELELAKPFKDYHEFQGKLKTWEQRKLEISGTPETNGTIAYYEKELDYLENKLNTDLAELSQNRTDLILKIYAQKMEIQKIYNKMKEAISNILSEFSQEQNITIETSFKVNRLFYSRFFDYVNRYGYFYQEGDEALKKLISKYNFNNSEHLVSLVDELSTLDIRIKEGRKIEFYNYIGSIDFINPEYDLRLNNISINQLSPGEKGGLLLVFYLVLDKDNKPLIIDQPEDNLDNQSIAEILVPYIKSAKKKRQVIMITHNPNLAIVADAEQVIYMNIDKENNFKISFDSGGIEKKSINNRIVDILEGKMKAFNNRRVKYRND